MTDKRDLLILGGGLVGMTLALAAAKKGLSSHLVDRADPASLTAEGFDGRASAISTASWRLFRHIGLEQMLEPHGCDIAAIAVLDQMKAGRLDFRPEPHEGTLGRMFANRQLRLALHEAAEQEPLIEWHAPVDVTARERGEFGVSATLGDGRVLEAALMAAIGAVLGLVLLYVGLTFAQPQVDSAFGLWLPIAPPSARELSALAAVIGAAALTSLLPALRAYRLSLADGMMIRI